MMYGLVKDYNNLPGYVLNDIPTLPQCPFTLSVSVKFTLTDRMDLEPILSIKRSISFGTMIKFDRDGTLNGPLQEFFSSLDVWSKFKYQLPIPVSIYPDAREQYRCSNRITMGFEPI